MLRISFFGLCFVLLLSPIAHSRPDENVTALRIDHQSDPTLKSWVTSHGTLMHFGLRLGQARELRALSQGRVNLEGLYWVATPILRARYPQFARLREYQGTFSNRVRPPATMQPHSADPMLQGQWWVQKLNVPAAWERASGKNVVLADCDAGYYLNESDLKPNLLDQYRRNFSDPAHPEDVETGEFIYHGTAVAAIMASVLDGKGTNGIAFSSRVVPLQNYSYSGRDQLDKEEATAACVLAAIAVPSVRIIVLENQTGDGSSETFIGTRQAVTLALAAGITVVSAAGNYEMELKIEEEFDTGSIIVGALEPNGDQASFSNFGKRVSIAAYGSDLYTLCLPNGEFCDFGGTSGATPQVAAAVALMLEANPLLTPPEVKRLLELTRITTPSNQKVGGRLDVQAAVNAASGYKPIFGAFQAREALRKKVVQILRHP